MKLPKEAVQEFIELYKTKYGDSLDYAEGEEMAQELFNLYLLSQGQNI